MIAIVVLLVLSAVFSGTETAFTSLSYVQQKTLENQKSRSARMAARLCQKSDVLITTVLVGNNVVNISVSSLVTTYSIARFGNNAVGYATGLLTLLILVFGEITPKQIALTHNMKIATFMAYPIRTMTIVLFPVVWLLKILSRTITRLFSKDSDPHITAEGVMHMVDAAEDYGVVDEYESELMQRAIHFSEMQAKTIMTHRTEVSCISDELTIRQAFPLIVDSGFSRTPVYHGNVEDITGVLLVRDILKAHLEGNLDVGVSTIARKPAFVPEQMHLDDLFFLFKQDNLQLVVVLDEYGGFSGVVTMEDVAEQLFGELYDEHEKRSTEKIVESELAPGTYIVKADTPFMQLIDELALGYPHDGKTSTVASYLLDLTGDIPKEGDVLQTPIGTFRIIQMKGHRMEEIEFSPTVDDGTL
jgi:CBS domain containing-hemolysin-like protein